VQEEEAMDRKPEKTVTGKSSRLLRTKEFFEEEKLRAAARKERIIRAQELQKLVIHQHPIRKRQIEPTYLMWIAVFFFFIDYFAFQITLPSLIIWLLTVIPLLLIATAFFIWGQRKLFPWISFPLDPLIMNTISNERSNALHSFIFSLVCIFLVIMVTIVVMFNK
jgi:hypothetical protein